MKTSGFWVRSEAKFDDTQELYCLHHVGCSFFKNHDSEKISKIIEKLPKKLHIAKVVNLIKTGIICRIIENELCGHLERAFLHDSFSNPFDLI